MPYGRDEVHESGSIRNLTYSAPAWFSVLRSVRENSEIKGYSETAYYVGKGKAFP